jgi:hypothetical protein
LVTLTLNPPPPRFCESPQKLFINKFKKRKKKTSTKEEGKKEKEKKSPSIRPLA